MRRRTIEPRPNWQNTVESQGMYFHAVGDRPYWDESAFYSFTSTEIDDIEKATNALDGMCLAAIEHVFQNDLLELFCIPEPFRDWLWDSWQNDERTIYGRFDLAFRPGCPPNLLEYNADTPTALLEAAVIQWHWLQDTRLGRDQFNSIHERLIEAWATARPELATPVYFAAQADHLEDYMTVNYLRDTAMQAGLATEYLNVEDIAWNSKAQQFVDSNEQPIQSAFKLYPWEWMLDEEFGPHLLKSRTRWLEPPWKMILSNKAILPLLWQLYPQSPYLLKADYEPLSSTYVAKPFHGREGANVQIIEGGTITFESGGPYDGPRIYQELCPLPEFEGNFALIGSWMVNGYACGLGMREDSQLVTHNTSRFVPHCIE